MVGGAGRAASRGYPARGLGIDGRRPGRVFMVAPGRSGLAFLRVALSVSGLSHQAWTPRSRFAPARPIWQAARVPPHAPGKRTRARTGGGTRNPRPRLIAFGGGSYPLGRRNDEATRPCSARRRNLPTRAGA
jgi:hypothetical protein